ncbi:polysaccharide pyruvyl transferase family protein [Hoylesella shahii]|mgnify:FL=1|jgi:hypothetical protein|uniref:polysaccharide pyruvyl transferase family protein n=1 Tax=Hoylesella shahii TaxID=228603 RepID=UPI00248F462C|nr:polysaccharide pyruvyl transferase family protein [Hoylesella shahii]
MKIGIITFHCAHNYGAVLQAYGLKEFLKLSGHSVNVVNYRPRYIVNTFRKFNLRYWLSRNPYKCIVRLFIEIIVKPIRIKRWYVFERFMDEYLDLSPYSKENNFSYLDFLVLGSDQIWNPKLTGGNFDGVYFGNGAKCNVISYAASSRFESLSLEQQNYFSINLSNLKGISVRESSLADLLQPLVNLKVNVVVDPTLLAGREVFDDIAISPKKEKYLLLYQIGQWTELNNLARKIAEKLNLEIIEISSHPIEPRKGLVQTASPNEFVGYFKDATFIVTTSFHGLAFSIMYNRQFYCLKKNSDSDLRLLSLLDKLDLQGRFLEIGEEPDFEFIDYNNVNQKLKRERDMSVEYLQKSINLG